MFDDAMEGRHVSRPRRPPIRVAWYTSWPFVRLLSGFPGSNATPGNHQTGQRTNYRAALGTTSP